MAEIESLLVHSRLTSCPKHGYKPDLPLLQTALRSAARKMQAATFVMPADFLQRSHFERVLQRLELRSSPGLPLCRIYPTTGDFLRGGSTEFIPERVSFLWGLVQEKLRSRRSDDLRVFIKLEPHKLSKLAEKRYRLIACVGLADQVIDQMLFGDFNDFLIDLWGQIPCMPGWSPLKGGWRCLPYDKVGIDRSAWDWGVPRWLLEAELDLRKMLVDSNPEWEELVDWRYSCLYDQACLMTSDGTLWFQKMPGIVKSGAVNTISSNTMMQLILHEYVSLIVGEPTDGFFFAMGDDTYQDPVSTEYFDCMSKIVRLKVPQWSEFCSMVFRSGYVEPLNYGKHVMRLTWVAEEDLRNACYSMQVNYARSLRWDQVVSLVRRIDPSMILTRQTALAVMDGEVVV